MRIMEIKSIVAQEIEREQKLKSFLDERSLFMPSGSLSVTRHGDKEYYSHVKYNENNRKKVYLDQRKKNENNLIELLKEKRNITYALPILNNNIKQMQQMVDSIKEYDPLHTRYGNQLGKEHYLEGDVCIKEWLNESYNRNPFHPEMLIYETKRGDLVRSKSEMMIADILFELDIPYRIESPLWIGNRTIYPDFELLNLKKRALVWWEHFGMLHDPGYNANAYHKISELGKRGIYPGENLIITFETEGFPLTRSIIFDKLKETGFI